MRKQPPKAHAYPLPSGWTILAGKTDSDNDTLTFEVARPNDYWFHVHGMPGSHVILTSDFDGEPSKEDIKSAAAVAVYHSKARQAGVTPVVCTQAKHISKPRGAKAGTVQTKRDRILKVRPGLPENPKHEAESII